MVDTRNLDRPRFDVVVEAYHRFRTGYSEQAIDAITAAIPRPGNVLDVATGTGILSRQIAPHVSRIIGCDVSLAMIRAAGGTVVQARAERLPFPDRSFDALTCAQAFHWFDSTRAAAEFHRVVRRGGLIAILRKDSDRAEPYEWIADRLIEEFTGIPQSQWNPSPPNELGSLRELRFSWEADWTIGRYVGWMSSRESIRQLLAKRLPEFLNELEKRLRVVAPNGYFRERQIDYLFIAHSQGA